MTPSHYDTLDITPDATDAEVKQAYRRASAKAHPDRNGGDTEQQQRVNAAYECLGDPARRADYDATGGGDPARERLIKLFEGYLATVDTVPNFEGIIPRCERMVRDSIAQLQKIKQGALARAARIERSVNKVQGPAMWETLCRKHIERHLKDGRDADTEIATNARVLEMLAAYRDVSDTGTPPMSSSGGWLGLTDSRG